MHPHPLNPQHHGRRRSAATTALFKITATLGAAILIGHVLGTADVALAQGQPITFAAVGDVPYSTGEISEFQEHMDNLDLYSGSEFLVHLGDIKSGGGSCTESWYQSMAASLRTLSIPAFIVPGDNEWNDCSNPTQAWGLWVKHLMAIEQVFCGLPVVERQSVRQENFAFVKSGVLFIGINKVSGGLGSGETQTRLQQDGDWITQQMQSKRNSVRAAVIFAQARPSGSPLESMLSSAVSAFGKPVLYIHGDGHSWTYDEGYLEPNMTKVQVDRGSINFPPVHVTVTMDPNLSNAFVFNRDPWPNGTTPVNKAPCANAGPDRQIPSGASTVLNGTMSDDGEPTSAPLQVTWTHVSGQGTVTFSNRNAASTTASFSANDNYTLRMTVSDGALTGSDTVVVAVGVTPNAAPVVTITAPASGSQFNLGENITFTGSASDDFDSGLTASLSWMSNNYGHLGTGGTVSTSTLPLGEHTITASVTDSGGRTGSESIVVTIVDPGSNPPSPSTVDVRVANGNDDAEESATGSVSLSSSDLELVADGSNQTVGMRFNGVNIQRGATINNAWIQFQTDQATSGATTVSIRGQAIDNAPVFTTAAANLSSRTKTTAAVSWSPVPWNSVGAAGADQQTPNLSSVIQEIVNRPGWSSGNSLAILITGTGQRTAESYNGVANGAPLLHIESAPSDPAPDIDAAPNPYGFGSATVNSTVSGTIAIRNLGSEPLVVDTNTWSGADAAQFGITNGSAPFTVAPNATHNLVLSFTPTSLGPKTAALQLATNDPNEGTVDLTLTGTGTTPADIEATPTSHSYGSALVGANPAQTFTIRNVGGANLQVTGTSLVGTDPGQFAITSGGGSFTLASNATRTIEVRFVPTSGGFKSASLSLTSNDPDEATFTIGLDGTGTTAPEIVISPTSHNYGAQQLNTTVSQSFVVSNTGSSALVVGSPTLSGADAGSFAITSGQSGFTVQPNGSASIQVQFTPTSEGPKIATLTITSNDGDESSVTVGLSGSGFVPGAAPPTFIEAQQGGSANTTTVTTNAALTGVNGHLYLAAISMKSYRAVTTVTGLGLTWTRVAWQCSGRNQTGVELWWAQGNATSGMVTATLASAPSNAVIAVARYSGAASVTPVASLVAGNTNGVNGACANGTDGPAYTFNVTTSQPNALVVGAIASRNHAHTPGAGYAERIEAAQGASTGNAARVALVDRGVSSPSTLPLNGTLASSTDWAIVAVQLRP